MLRRCVWSRNIKNGCSIYIYDISRLRVKTLFWRGCQLFTYFYFFVGVLESWNLIPAKSDGWQVTHGLTRTYRWNFGTFGLSFGNSLAVRKKYTCPSCGNIVGDFLIIIRRYARSDCPKLLHSRHEIGGLTWKATISAGERPAAAHLLKSWVRIPPGAWIFVCCECRVLSGRGLCDELITRPEESHRLCCVVVCDLETSRIGAPYIYMTLVA